MISVVMATYNGEKFIKEQLYSIKNQELQADEVIIRDDCSEDKTAEIVKSFIANNNLKKWNFEVNSSNKGFKKNFYDLLKLVNGDIIFLSDQDDVWMANKISTMSKKIQENPQIETLNCGIKLVDQNLNAVEIKPRKNFYNANLLYSENTLQNLNFFGLENMIKRNISPGCSMCITRKIKEQFLKTYNFVVAHDWYMNLLASLNNNCCFLNEQLIDYRIHQENTLGLATAWSVRSKLVSFNADNQVKLREFRELSITFKNIVENYAINDSQGLQIQNYLNVRISFLMNPKLRTLLKLRKFSEYFNSTTIRGRIWDIVII
ncbi:MAG: glycosyltransferase, partial [Liquorilactobacillus sp.]